MKEEINLVVQDDNIEAFAIIDRHEFSVIGADNETIGTATIINKEGVYWLTNVWVHHTFRRRGMATQLLNTITEIYNLGVLYLQVWPYTNQPVDAERLTEWYSRFGFAPTDVPGIMKRLVT